MALQTGKAPLTPKLFYEVGVRLNNIKAIALFLGIILLAGCSSSGNFTPRVAFIIEFPENVPDDLTRTEKTVATSGFHRISTERDNKVFSQPLMTARWIGFYELPENPNLRLQIMRILSSSFTGPDYSTKSNALEVQLGEYCGWCNIGCFSDSGRTKILQTYKLLVREFEPENVKIRSNCMNRSERKEFFQLN